MKIIEVCEALILNDKKQILLQLRDCAADINEPGKWGILGGGKEGQETPLDCLKREIKEEIGLEASPKLIDTIDDKGDGKIYRHYIYSFFCNDEARSLSLAEGQEVKFFDLNEIMELDKVEWFARVYYPAIKKLNFIIPGF